MSPRDNTGAITDTRAPLAGIRIAAVEQYGAGPFGTLYLADLGAEIIRIEDPATGGDVSRYIPPGRVGSDSLFFEAFNRNKRSLCLDLKNSAGREVFERLVATSDAVFNNLRGDQPRRLSLTYDTLSHVNPTIVCVSLSGYGATGESARLPGYDAVIQAESGWAALTGGPDDPPTKSGLSLVDYVGGLTSALGLLAGVLDARRTGRGRDVQANLYDSALAMLSYPATWYLSNGFVSQRRPLSAHPSVVPFQFFPTADGFIAVACAKDKFYRALVVALDLPELAVDPRYVTFEDRRANETELLAVLEARFLTLPSAEWLRRLRGIAPVAPVRSLQEALDPDELGGRGMLAQYEHPVLGTVRSVGLPLAFDGFEASYRPGPSLGADEVDVLSGLGYDKREIAALGVRGAFGSSSVAPREADALV